MRIFPAAFPNTLCEVTMDHPSISRIVIAGLAACLTIPPAVQASGTWDGTSSLNTPRIAHTATLLANGQVLVAGGETTSGTVLATAEIYTVATGKWAVTGSMTTARYGHSATLLANGEVLVAGGYTGSTYIATAELYNPATGKWTSTGSMTMPRDSHGAVLLANGQVLAAGGTNSNGTAGSSAELYTPMAGSWRSTGVLHASHLGPATLLGNGQVLVADTTGEVYNPATGSWTETAREYYPGHSGISASRLASGDALIFGNHLVSYTSEFYNPQSNVWTGTKGQTGGQVGFGPLALLLNGKVLLGGGTTSYRSPTPTSMLYDPSTNTWTLTGRLLQAANHTLTVLLNGQVLAVGGSDAELYTP